MEKFSKKTIPWIIKVNIFSKNVSYKDNLVKTILKAGSGK